MIRIAVRVVLSLALGLLGPHPNIVHVGYEPVGPCLFRLPKDLKTAEMDAEAKRAAVYAVLESYVISCIVAFLVLTLLARFIRGPKKEHMP